MHSGIESGYRSKGSVDLSVVIITKNEEEMIGCCIESTLAALRRAEEAELIKSSEIVLSDSASTDGTLDVARKYPVKIVQLGSDWPLSASAGRYVGYLNTNAKFVFFLDGDCVVCEEWFINALPYHTDPQVAAVEGFFDEFVNKGSFFHDSIKEQILGQRVEKPTFVENVGGPAIFKSSVLDEVGGFHPYLKGGEDRDLSYRILSAGYKLLRIHDASYVHHWAKKTGMIRYWTLLRSTLVWSVGDGQSTRINIKNSEILRRQRRRYFRWGIAKGYLPGVSVLLLLLFNVLGLLHFLSSFTVLAVILDVLFAFVIVVGADSSKKSVRRFLYDLFERTPYVLIRHAGFIWGFLRRLPEPSAYPTDARVSIVESSP